MLDSRRPVALPSRRGTDRRPFSEGRGLLASARCNLAGIFRDTPLGLARGRQSAGGCALSSASTHCLHRARYACSGAGTPHSWSTVRSRMDEMADLRASSFCRMYTSSVDQR